MPERAESKARIELSEYLERGSSTESRATLEVYVSSILEHTGLRNSLGIAPSDFAERQEALIDMLRNPDVWGRIWSRTSPGLHEALSSLREEGLALLIVSNADGTVGEKLAACGLADSFDAVVDSGQLGVEKPDPRIFEEALKIAGCTKDEALHVGDLPSVDLAGAAGAGIHGILMDPFGDFADRFPNTCESVPALAQRILAAR